MATTTSLFPTSVDATTGSTWTTTSNATGSGTGTTSAAWAVFTTATSAAVGTLTLGTYGAQGALGVQPASIDSIVVSCRQNVGTVARWTSASVQLFSNGTAIGSAQSLTLSTTTSNSQDVTFTGANLPTWSQLANLQVQFSATKSGTVSSTFNVDTAGLVVNYTPAVVGGVADDFSTADSTKWAYGDANIAVSAGRLNITDTAAYPTLLSQSLYNLTGSAAYLQVITPPNVGNGTTQGLFSVGTTVGSTEVRFEINNGTLYANSRSAGVDGYQASAAFAVGTNDWLRIREAGGTTFWEVSGNGTTWSAFASLANPFAMTAVRVGIGAGFYGTEPTPGTLVVDNFNTTNNTADLPPLFAPPPGLMSPRGQLRPFLGDTTAAAGNTASPVAGNAAGTGQAFDAAITVSPAAGNAAGVGQAFDAVATGGVPAGNASGTGQAFQATVATTNNVADVPPLPVAPPGRLSPAGRWSPFVGDHSTSNANPSAGHAAGAATGAIESGVYVVEPFDTPTWTTNLDAYDTAAGIRPSIVNTFVAWSVTSKGFPSDWGDFLEARGQAMCVSWEPWDYTGTETQPAYQLADIIAGTYDSYITGWATAAAAWGKPCYLRFAHEMNGNWYPWAEAVNGNTAGQYVTAWQHVRDIFTAAGATNVKWIWAPNVVYSGSTALAGLYPGDSYVDVVGVDGYNFGTTLGGTWTTFADLFDPTITALQAVTTSKSIFITETACSEDGGDKAAWITDMWARLIERPVIHGVWWFNLVKEANWPITSTTGATTAFAAGANHPRYAVVPRKQPIPSVAPAASAASGTGTALSPTVATTNNVADVPPLPVTPPGRISPAGRWSPFVGDPTPAPAASASAGVAAGTGQATDATVAAAPVAGNAAGTGAAQAPAPNVAPTASAAAGTGVVPAPTLTIAPVAGNASGTGAALDTTVATTNNVADVPPLPVAPPGRLSPAGRWSPFVGDPTSAPTADASPSAGLAAGTGTASDVTVTIAPVAGNAAGTGTANSPAPAIAPVAGNAAGTGTANAPTAAVAPVAGNGAGTGTAQAATPNVGPVASAAAGTGTAQSSTLAIAPAAAAASGTGAALDTTVTTANNTADVPPLPVMPPGRFSPAGRWSPFVGDPTPTPVGSASAGVAAGSGTAFDATVAITASPGNAAGTGAAQAPTPNVGVAAGNAAATGAANQPTITAASNAAAGLASGAGSAGAVAVNIGATAGAAAGTGTAQAPTLNVGPAAGVATGVGAANQPTITAASNAAAGLASGTGAAGAPALNIGPAAGAGTGTGQATDTTSNAAIGAVEAATGSGLAFNAAGGAAFDPGPLPVTPPGRLSPKGRWAPFVGNVQAATDARPDAGQASATGTAFDATVTVAPAAGNAAGTGTAGAATPSIASSAGAAAGTGTANTPRPNVGVGAANAAGTGTAYPATVVAPNATAGAATGAGAAFNAAVSTSRSASAGLAAGTGTASGATLTLLIVIPDPALGTGAAFDTSNGVPVVLYPLHTGAVVDQAVREHAGTVTDQAGRNGTGLIDDQASRYHTGTPV